MAYPIREFTQRVRALVLKRAIDLVATHKVVRVDRDDDHAQFHVENQRGGFYRVEIRLKSDKVTFTHCECPYRGVGLCKHTAASLLDILVQEGLLIEELLDSDFIFEDSEVIEEDGYEDALKSLIKEISQDTKFNLTKFLDKQDQQDLLAFIMKYLEESEDIRLVVMAYLWYKNTEVNPPHNYLS